MRPASRAGAITVRRVPGWFDTLAAYSWRVLAVVAATAVGLYVFAALSLVFVPVIIALLATTVLAPPAHWLRGRGWPRALVAIVLVVGSVLVIGAVIAVLAPQVAEEVGDFWDQLGDGADDAVEWAIHGPLPIDAAQARELLTEAGQQLRANAGRIMAGVLSGAVVVVEMVVGLLLAVVLLFFFVKDGDRMVAWMLGRVPPDRREQVAVLARRGWTALGGYIRGAAVVALVDAVGIGIGLWVIGVPLVLPLALLTFAGGFFPIVGANVAGLAAVLIALVTRGVLEAVLTFLVVLTVQQVESNVLQPVIVGRAVRLHPVVVLLAITAGAVVGGVMGAFLAVPAVAVASAVGNELRLRQEATMLASDHHTESAQPAER